MFNLQDVSDRIISARKNKGLTQMELANILGISYQAVSNWERGVSMPDISNLEPLADALGITVDEILSDKKISSIINDGVMPESLSAAEFNAVSPLLRPEQNEELITKVVNSGQIDEPLNVSSLGLTHNDYDKLVENFYDEGQIAPFAVLSVHCSEEFVSRMIDRAFNDGNTAFFAVLVRLVSNEKRIELFKKCADSGNTPFLAVLAPHIKAYMDGDKKKCEKDDDNEDEE